MIHQHNGVGRWSFAGRVLASIVVLASGTMVATQGAGARGNADDPDYEAFVNNGNHFNYVIEARGYGPYAHIPYKAYNGSPYGRAELASVPGRCFVISSQYYGDQYGEEFLFEGGQKSVTNPGEARAEYPETVRNAKHVEVGSPFPGGPKSIADCKNIREADALATYNFNGDATNHVGFATSRSHAALDIVRSALSGESQAILEDVSIGGQLNFKRVESFMKVDQLPNQEPKFTYRLALFGITAGGTPVAGIGDKGVVLAGQNVSSADMYKQFADQVNKNAEAFKAMAAWRIEVLAPKMTHDDVEYDIRSPVFTASQRPAGQADKRGEEQGFILGEIRYRGVYNNYAGK